MGVFNLLCSCCLGRPKRYKESLVENSYVPYGPSVNEVADTSIKAKVVESKQPAKEITPPPNYSVNSLSRVQTIVSSAPANASPTPSYTEIKNEQGEAVSRVIKPLPQRRDKRTNVVEQKSLVQTPLPPGSFENSAEPVAHDKKDKKGEEAGSSKPVQLFVFPKSNADVENNVAVASSATATTTTTKMTTTATGAASIALVAKPAGTTTIFDRLAASNPHPVPTTTPVTPTPVTPTPVSNSAPVLNTNPVSNPTPVPNQAPAPAPAPNPFLTLALRPARPTPNTPANTTAPLSTTKTVLTHPAHPTTSTATTSEPQPSPSSSTTTSSPGRLCPTCSARNDLEPTKADNLNHDRPYRLCSNTKCKSWNGFADTRGLDARQQCDCSPSYPMRLVAMNKTDGWGRRKAFWSCQYKACKAWGVCLDDAGQVRWFGRGEVEEMVKEGRI